MCLTREFSFLLEVLTGLVLAALGGLAWRRRPVAGFVPGVLLLGTLFLVGLWTGGQPHLEFAQALLLVSLPLWGVGLVWRRGDRTVTA